MNVVLFGATGMVGQGVLRECLLDNNVKRVTAVGRTSTDRDHRKLTNLMMANLYDYGTCENDLTGFDACFFCLGVSSAGMEEGAYAAITFDLTLAAATALLRYNPSMIFIYVSGAGTDSSENGSSMWARVKGRTENALLRLPFRASYMFRPGIILPRHGVRSKTKLYRAIYQLFSPLGPLLQWLFPTAVMTSQQLGQAMLVVAEHGASKTVLEASDIIALLNSNPPPVFRAS